MECYEFIACHFRKIFKHQKNPRGPLHYSWACLQHVLPCLCKATWGPFLACDIYFDHEITSRLRLFAASRNVGGSPMVAVAVCCLNQLPQKSKQPTTSFNRFWTLNNNCKHLYCYLCVCVCVCVFFRLLLFEPSSRILGNSDSSEAISWRNLSTSPTSQAWKTS